jgi:fructose-1,6-bisphosphatase-3
MTVQSNITPESIVNDLRYLQLLSRSFPTIADASTEIINLEAILNLPKGTEHFLTDIHGEYEAFQHVLKNASGAVKRKVNEIFGNTLREAEKKEICTLIYRTGSIFQYMLKSFIFSMNISQEMFCPFR